jgi:tRNA pseudouridine38-40 synthase
VNAPTNWKLTLAYDGSGFHGWQIQSARSGLATIQGTLSEAIARLTGEHVLPQGSGRTDAGVHALAQVVSFRLAAPVPAANLHRALNRLLPPSIRVLSCDPVPDSFHARHSARSKTYEYRIFERRPERRIRLTPSQPAQPAEERICSPFLAPFVWDCRWPLSLDAMTEAAALLLGSHDFTSMAATDPDRSLRDPEQERPQPNTGDDSPSPRPTQINPVKTITLAEWSRVPASDRPSLTASGPDPCSLILVPSLLLFRIAGTGFLHHMVRNIVGTLVEIGRGSLAPSDLTRILDARDRTAAGPTAPAHGLYLVEVGYNKIVTTDNSGTGDNSVTTGNVVSTETPDCLHDDAADINPLNEPHDQHEAAS